MVSLSVPSSYYLEFGEFQKKHFYARIVEIHCYFNIRLFLYFSHRTVAETQVIDACAFLTGTKPSGFCWRGTMRVRTLGSKSF